MEAAFLEPQHLRLAADAWAFARDSVAPTAATEVEEGFAIDPLALRFVKRMAEASLLRHCVPQEWGGFSPNVDVRSLCVIREALAYASGLCDVMFSIQCLGAGPLSLFGSEEQRARWLPEVAKGEAVAAYALTEPRSGSDPSLIETTARRDNAHYVLNGVKRFISNAGLANFYVVFARVTPEPDTKDSLTAFLVPADNAGLRVNERLELIAPHPIGEIGLEGCRVPRSARIGEEGQGLRIALSTLDTFRPTVGAAAVGFARRALDEALDHVSERVQFGGPLAMQQGVQFMLAEMATELDAARLLVYRAAHNKDMGAARITLEASMAKYYATEVAQRIVDRALQLHGGNGVVRGVEVERLYREVRALRIYEGATEVQKMIIAREILRGRAARSEGT
jgi:acyl-CoA dehydrogenase